MTKRIRVHMTWQEIYYAAVKGVARQVRNLKDGTKDKHGAKEEDGWTYNIKGCLGEAIVSKGLDKYWSGALGDRKADDVGPYQVRWGSQPHYKLIIYKKDDPNKKYILVTAVTDEPREFDIVGWAWGYEGQNDDYWTDPGHYNRPNYFVPQKVLHDMDEL